MSMRLTPPGAMIWGIPARPAAVRRVAPALTTEPCRWFDTSTSEKSITQAKALLAASASNACPPMPVVWKIATSKPRASSAGFSALMYLSDEVPSEVMPMTGRVASGASTARAAPTTAPAAWLSEDLQIALRP